MLLRQTLAAFSIVSSLAIAGHAAAAPKVVSGAGEVLPLLVEFRKLLGEPNNANAKGSQKQGRREINWDGVDDAAAAPKFLKHTGFRARGAVLHTPGMASRSVPAPAIPRARCRASATSTRATPTF